ncbi:MAG: hypothetical protein ABSA75_15720 [Candidatus Bathyarchaeia archaeon]
MRTSLLNLPKFSIPLYPTIFILKELMNSPIHVTITKLKEIEKINEDIAILHNRFRNGILVVTFSVELGTFYSQQII